MYNDIICLRVYAQYYLMLSIVLHQMNSVNSRNDTIMHGNSTLGTGTQF